MFRSVAGLMVCACLLKGTPQSFTSPALPPPRLPTSSEALHAAIRAGKLDEAKRLIAAGADSNARDSLGNTPLMYAVWSGNAEAGAFLLGHGADANAEAAGRPALAWAVLAGRTALVQMLISAGARVDTRERDGGTLLHVAVARGYEQIAELLLSAGAEVGATDAWGRTPLDEAALFGQSAVIPVLLRHGADPKRVRPEDGRGPLHEAGVKGSGMLIETLVKAGADPSARDKSGQTALDLALAYKNRSAIAALERLAIDRSDCQAAAESAMESATERGHSELARLLLDGGFDLNKRSPGGSTYLHEAALRGQSKLVQLFLDRGADVKALDGSGGTALHDAALGGSADVIGLLLDRGAPIDVADGESGATPLMLAASVSRAGAVALLLKRGANPRLRDHAGHTALDRARETEDSETVKLLEGAVEGAARGGKTAV